VSISIKFESNIKGVVKEVQERARELLENAVVEKIGTVSRPVHGTTPARVTKVGEGQELKNFR